MLCSALHLQTSFVLSSADRFVITHSNQLMCFLVLSFFTLVFMYKSHICWNFRLVTNLNPPLLLPTAIVRHQTWIITLTADIRVIG